MLKMIIVVETMSPPQTEVSSQAPQLSPSCRLIDQRGSANYSNVYGHSIIVRAPSGRRGHIFPVSQLTFDKVLLVRRANVSHGKSGIRGLRD